MSKINTISGLIEDLQKLFPEMSITEVLSHALDIDIPYIDDRDMEALLKEFLFQNMT